MFFFKCLLVNILLGVLFYCSSNVYDCKIVISHMLDNLFFSRTSVENQQSRKLIAIKYTKKKKQRNIDGNSCTFAII